VVAYSIGSRTVLGFGAASLAILSFLKDNEVKSILKANEQRYIKYHEITANSIKRMIKKVRKIGYVFSESYHFKGMNGVGVPIFNADGDAIAAISVGAIADQLDFERSKHISAFIKAEIQLIS
jgi:DNA-binding IclR family transcriptional regulator